MQALVEKRTINDNYVILERAPHALVRLAHESLNTANPNDLNEEPKKQEKQEYGLRTRHLGEERPISYSIELAGVNDIRSATGDYKTGDKVINQESSQKTQEQYTEGGNFQQNARLNRPLMFARFDTADFLVVIDRLEDTPVVTRSLRPGDYYDTTYDAKAVKRTATVKVNARILNKDGQIMWVRNIAQQASDIVLPEPLGPPVQTWTEKKKNKKIAGTSHSTSNTSAATDSRKQEPPTQSNNTVMTGVNSLSDSITTAKDAMSAGASLIKAITQ